MKDDLIVGRILGAHGVRGDIKVYPLTDDVKRFDQLKSCFLLDGDEKRMDTLHVNTVRYSKDAVILNVLSVSDRDQAQAMKGLYLAVTRQEAAPLSDGRYFIVDLIGCEMLKGDQVIGKVSDIIQTGANDVFIVKRAGLPDLLVPFISSVVADVCMDEKQIRVNLPDGLEDIYAPS